jgi:hypothetical protein
LTSEDKLGITKKGFCQVKKIHSTRRWSGDPLEEEEYFENWLHMYFS